MSVSALNKLNMDDTIVGVSTPTGGSISIIRMSGKGSLHILKKVFEWKDAGKPKSHRVYYGWICGGMSEKVDEVLVSVMLAPRTFTREDVVEINCHGGAMATQKVLMLLVEHGARLAEAGEFTKRAFLNGRIDLSQAEATMDIINAKSELSHKSAVNQLQGRLAHLLSEACEGLVSLLARIEMAIDYPEHEEADIVAEEIKTKIIPIAGELNKLLDVARAGKIIRDGIKTAIIGEPNVGKSSLLNALAREDRAIVTHIPGTTRDVLRETIKIGDIFLELADTAGIRDTDDLVESEGVARSLKESVRADLVLLVFDGSKPFEHNKIASIVNEDWENVIVIINKSDLPQGIDKDYLTDKFGESSIIEISAKNHIGIDELGDKIKDMFLQGQMEYGDDLVTNARHISLINSSRNSLVHAIETIDTGLHVDFVAIDIQAAYAALGEILGIAVDEELIEKIFSEFCLGK
ncbi:MAG: tRNA uridine-5-carboxymethylaminomethyl(34) synthesis GTPase MnmE [Defluviitaleaceae bacterium]|nr:tRNA uridine-5-carboxymethylaminomethyl(34) synthesis GTPase MnmE [Defluviitaleaceae bacterium]